MQSNDGRILFACTPHEFVVFTNDAFLVNCVDCINWFKNWFPREHQLMPEYLNQTTNTLIWRTLNNDVYAIGAAIKSIS